MAKTINRRLAELIDGSGQLQTGKLPNAFITTAHYSSNSITDAKLHTSFSLPASALTARDTGDLSEGSNLYYTTARWDSKLAAADTGDLSEGSNLYYTDARVQTYIGGNRSYGIITGTTPTASGGTNTTALASTAFVQQELTTLIGGAPSTLNDLNELAAAINDDSNYNTTLTTALATKLPLAGGTMTGQLVVDTDTEHQIKIDASSSSGASMHLNTAGGYAYTVYQNSNRIWRIGAYGGSSFTIRDHTGGTDPLVIDSSGKVGIGTNDPDARLGIKSSGASSYPLLIKSSDNQQLFRFREESDTRGTFYINDASENSKVTLASDGHSSFMGGNVGIGEATPLGKLHIKGTDTTASSVSAQGTSLILEDVENGMTLLNSSSGAGYIWFADSDAQNGAILYDHSTDAMRFRTGGNWDVLKISGSGSIGVGTSISAHAFSKAIEIGDGAVWSVGGNQNSSFTSNAYLASNASWKYIASRKASMINLYNGGFNVQTTDTTGTAGNNITFETRLQVLANGNVGIGNTNPNLPLTVTSNSGANAIAIRARSADDYGFIQFYNHAGTALRGQIFNHNGAMAISTDTTGTARLHIDTSGNVGIGTDSPAAGLQVAKGLSTAGGPAAGASTAAACFGNDTSDDNYGLVLGADGNGLGYISAQRTDGTATTYPLVMQHTGGKVGIGTTSPTMPLSVQAASNAYAISMHGRSDGYSELYGASNDGSTKYSFLQSHSAQTKLYTLVNTPLLFGTNSTERMRLSAAGDLQLESGAANKGYIQLSTQSTSYALMGGNHWGYLGYKTGGYHRWFGSDGVEDMRLDNSGNLGIGGSPNARLDISASVGVSLRFSSTYNYGPNRDWQINTNNYGSSNWGGWSLEQSTAQQGTPSVARIGVHANGNVGINMGGDASSGLTSINPATALHVGGDITVGSADAVGTSGAAAIRFQNDNERSRISSIYASGGGGELSFYTDSTGGTLLKRMHLSNSGELRFFGPSNLQVGGITSEGNDSLVISGNSANSAGIHMHPSQSAVVPAEGSGRAPTNTKDLGRSANSWRNIYLGTGMVQPDNTHTLQHDGGTDRGYKFNLGFIRGGSGSYNHIKTSLPSNTNVMMKFEYDGWIYSGSNMHESVTFYTYHAQSTPHGPTYVDYGSGGGLANVYYSSDNYVVIVIQAHTSYTGGFLYAQCGRSHYTTDIQILATGSNSTTSGVF